MQQDYVEFMFAAIENRDVVPIPFVDVFGIDAPKPWNPGYVAPSVTVTGFYSSDPSAVYVPQPDAPPIQFTGVPDSLVIGYFGDPAGA